MDLGINGRTALVTGASMGIGYAVAAELAANGVKVAIAARDEARLRDAAAALQTSAGGSVTPIAADMSRAEDIEKLISAANEALGQVDMLINNAGSTPAGRLEDIADETWRAALDLKLMGYVRTTRTLLPGMCDRGWGRVVNVIGIGGHQSNAWYAAGGAINAAILSLTKSVAKSCAGKGVTVNGVNPGPVDTPRRRTLLAQQAAMSNISIEEAEAKALTTIPYGRAATSEEIAGLCAFLCSARADYINGALIDVDGGMSSGL